MKPQTPSGRGKKKHPLFVGCLTLKGTPFSEKKKGTTGHPVDPRSPTDRWLLGRRPVQLQLEVPRGAQGQGDDADVLDPSKPMGRLQTPKPLLREVTRESWNPLPLR